MCPSNLINCLVRRSNDEVNGTASVGIVHILPSDVIENAFHFYWQTSLKNCQKKANVEKKLPKRQMLINLLKHAHDHWTSSRRSQKTTGLDESWRRNEYRLRVLSVDGFLILRCSVLNNNKIIANAIKRSWNYNRQFFTFNCLISEHLWEKENCKDIDWPWPFQQIRLVSQFSQILTMWG